ncbi:MAG TPA: hypothetical protein VK060_06965 [Ruania sp.]|nr:hypothetical protein [Ruania sp.]
MTEESQGESLVAILDELADLVASARSMPMSASVLVNRAEALELIESAKSVLPGQITRAQGVVADADAVLGRARLEASDLVERAKERAEELVSSESVVAQAKTRAEEIVTEARASADRLSREADDYCDRQLAQFEIDLNAISSQVSAGRARLEERARHRPEPQRASTPGDEGARSAEEKE